MLELQHTQETALQTAQNQNKKTTVKRYIVLELQYTQQTTLQTAQN